VFSEDIVIYNKDYKDESFEKFDLQKVMNKIWDEISNLDGFIQKEQPFKKIKENVEDGKKDMLFLVKSLYIIALKLEPFIPETSLKIQNLIKNNKMPESPLFPRKD
jgi:methionyl-tRNA synthetase